MMYNESGEQINPIWTYAEHELDQMFQDELDESPPVEIFNYVFDAGLALKSLDPIAYRQEFLAWVDANWQVAYDENGVEIDVYYAKED